MKILFAALFLATGIARAQTGPANPDICEGNSASGPAMDYVVHLKEGSVLKGKSWLCRDASGGSPAMRVRIDGRNIYPYQTDSIFEEGIRAVPAPGSTTWAFLIVEGRIRVYAPRPGRSLKEAVALSKDSEPLVRYTLKALEDRMRDAPPAADLVRLKRNAGRMSGIMAGVGAALTFIGLVTSIEEVPDNSEPGFETTKSEFHPNLLFFAGAGLLVGSWFLPFVLTENNPELALRRYNDAFAADSSGTQRVR